MISKKIACLLLSASVLTPAAIAAVETFDSECVEAAEGFLEPASISPTSPACCAIAYGVITYGGPGKAPGDVNGDGSVDLRDYILLKKYINSDGGATINKYSSDVNLDGQVDFLDLLALKSLI